MLLLPGLSSPETVLPPLFEFLILTMFRVLNELQEAERGKTKARDAYETFQQEAGSAQKKLLALQTDLLKKQETLVELEMVIRQLEESLKALQCTITSACFLSLFLVSVKRLPSVLAEIGTKLLSKLTDQEQKELIDLNASLDGLRTKMVDLTNKRTEAQSKKNVLEMKLSENLYSRQEELEKKLSVLEVQKEDLDLDVTTGNAQNLSNAVDKATTELNRISDAIGTKNAEIEKLRQAIDANRDVRSSTRTAEILNYGSKPVLFRFTC